ncbi:MAG: 3-oxoacyl-ACP reductase FabG [Syntrophomonadaceae bacterium]|jgi:3-oxoacyl-[acyl-carrier protein] reductase|nr:3-oxoacyl-ACP reductase FabG [Syntrophomonadaceae bacterium]
MKNFLVTGGGVGIGAAITKALTGEKNRVIINYLTSEVQASFLEKELTAQGFEVYGVKADVSQAVQVENMFSHIEQRWGTVDGLINNAGISLRKLFIDTENEEWDEVINVNLKSVFLCCKRALPGMLKKGWGRIVNISSVWGLHGGSCESAYAASKGGIIALSKSLAAEYGKTVTVNCIAPGAVWTSMLEKELFPEEIADLAADIPLGRLAYPEEIAAACAFLMSDGAGYINGQVLTVDGGWKLS